MRVLLMHKTSSCMEEGSAVPVSTRVLNINVGILGHVDSGKTSLVKALSTSLSTAALDKNPQSQRRGITLDLGFSSFSMDIPPHLRSQLSGEFDQIQFTLVDCPGHASLIRTIIGGAQIIDMIVLVIDINKGIQTQTAECIVIGEITTDKMIIVLNKVDLIPQEERAERIEKMMKRIRRIFSLTKFNSPLIIVTSAMIGGEKVASIGASTSATKSKKTKAQEDNPVQAVTTMGIEDLLEAIRSNLVVPRRNYHGSFHFSIDHCFAIKGHGTVLTGTILSGMVSVNQTIEFPDLQLQKKVKSMQMFHKPVKVAKQGDRVGVCVTNLDPNLIERGVATSSPSQMILTSTLICLVRKVRFFRQQCKSNSLFHISIGHLTVTATVFFFGAKELSQLSVVEESKDGGESKESSSGFHQTSFPTLDFDWDNDYEYQEDLISGTYCDTSSASSAGLSFDYQETHCPLQWMALQLHTPVYCTQGSLIIASKLDTQEISTGTNSSADNAQANSSSCRLAFYGPIKTLLPFHSTLEKGSHLTDRDHALHKLKLYRWKQRECEIQRLLDCRPSLSATRSQENNEVCYEAIGWKLYHKHATVKPFLGLKLSNQLGEAIGVIQGPFGASDKFRVKFPFGVPATSVSVGTKLYLKTKRYVFEKDKSLRQNGISFEGINHNLSNLEPDFDPVDESSPAQPLPPSELHEPIDGPDDPLPIAVTVSPPAVDERVEVDSPQEIQKAEIHLPTPLADSLPPSPTPNPVYVPTRIDITSIGKKSAPKLNVSTGSWISKQPVAIQEEIPKSPPLPPQQVKTMIPLPCQDPSPVVVSPPQSNKDFSDVRIGTIESLKLLPESLTECVAIVNGCFRIEENIRLYAGSQSLTVVYAGKKTLSGELVGPFAKMGKCKVRFDLAGLSEMKMALDDLNGSKVQIEITL